ncbi:MAG: sigma-54 dependent transcriptional regulator [Chitinophagales bacterium]|nr:sigma-54 dependent transcriptional regulator [Chitinophagales bacterium]
MSNIQAVKQRFGIIGNSPALNYALEVAIRVAPTNLSVLITGESGVGKEIFSQIIHQLSPRKHEGFIAVNCGAIPEGTIDSELFGHEKGSFTGANDQRKGYFETVNKGTIFLDEIGEMPIGTQARLLRVLEAGEFIKVGSSKTQKTDVRVLAATNVNLPKIIQQGKFREDLYYRLNTVPIYVPPLRERQEDIPVLFRKFCVDFAERYKTSSVKLTDDAMELLSRYTFPGNIRELKNIAEQVSVLSMDKIVERNDIVKFLPQNGLSMVPSVANKNEQEGFSDREILYKMLFDIKGDLNDLKRFVLNMASGGKYDMPEEIPFPTFKSDAYLPTGMDLPTKTYVKSNEQHELQAAPIIIDHPSQYAENPIDQNYSLAEMEKDLIVKALAKHHGKRRDAALDLGISERTLYRKIKEYDIDA